MGFFKRIMVVKMDGISGFHRVQGYQCKKMRKECASARDYQFCAKTLKKKDLY